MLWGADQKRYRGPSDPARPASAVTPAALLVTCMARRLLAHARRRRRAAEVTRPQPSRPVWNAVVRADGEPGNRPEVDAVGGPVGLMDVAIPDLTIMRQGPGASGAGGSDDRDAQAHPLGRQRTSDHAQRAASADKSDAFPSPVSLPSDKATQERWAAELSRTNLAAFREHLDTPDAGETGEVVAAFKRVFECTRGHELRA